MVYIQTGNIEEFIKKSIGKKVVCFGAGEHLDYIFKRFSEEKLYKYIDVIVDNKKELWGEIKHYEEKVFPIVSFDELCECSKHNELLIIITSHWYFNEIIMQMDQEKMLDRVEVFVGDLLDVPIVDYPFFEIRQEVVEKIPRIIHYCWFGGSTIPIEYQTYMETWKKCCPNYDIVRWDENNYDITKNRYIKQASEKKIWAFVSDFARVDIVNKYGGIYLDCDVELLKPLDVFLGTEMYCGFEDYKYINLGLGFGSVAGHPYLKSLLQYYESLEFVNSDGDVNFTACPFYQTEVIKSYGIIAKNSFQKTDSITVYPTEVFSPYSLWGGGQITDKSYSIHHFKASWMGKMKKERLMQWKILLKKLYKRIQMQ